MFLNQCRQGDLIKKPLKKVQAHNKQKKILKASLADLNEDEQVELGSLVGFDLARENDTLDEKR